MSKFTIRPITPEETASYIRAMFWSAGRPVDDRFIEERQRTFELDRALAAFDGDELIGTIGTRSLRMTLPGGNDVPIAAIGQGGVLPSHTRKGVMRALMMQSLQAARDRNEPLVAWTTSEWPLYERYGGGPATFAATYLLRDRSRWSLRRSDVVRSQVRLVSPDRVLDILPELHARVSTRPGGVRRDRVYWQGIIGSLEQGKSLDVLDSREDLPAALYCLMRDDSDSAAGCCAFRIHQKWEAGLFRSQMEIMFLLYASPAAAWSLWSFLLHIDLVESILIPHAPVDEPLRWMLTDGRRLETLCCQDHVWLRLLDPITVLNSRWFPRLARPLRIRVRDSLQISSCGTLEIMSDGTHVSVSATEADADVEMDVGTLSALLLGGNSAWLLAATDRITATTDDALRRLVVAFAPLEPPFTDTSF